MTTLDLAPVAVCLLSAAATPPEPADPSAASCVSEMSFCDLADSVAPSDSVSQSASPRRLKMTFTGSASQCAGPVDDAYSAWKMDCERLENLARVHTQQQARFERWVHENGSGAQENEEGSCNDSVSELSMNQLVQSMRNIERGVANLHLHFGTTFPPMPGRRNRRASNAMDAVGCVDTQQFYQCNTNIDAPNMNRQHATGGRGRGRRHANFG